MPTKRLPPRPDLDRLKRHARDLLSDCAAGAPQACQRLREFHPRFAGAADAEIAAAAPIWADALLAIAREYGFASWARLKAHVGKAGDGAERPLVDRIDDPLLRQAVELVDDGDVTALRRLLQAHPDLVTRRASFEGENYFRTPSLLAFVAENPVRNDALPPNIADVARLLIESRAADVDETLSLVASGRVAREAGVQDALIDLLCRHGADADKATLAAAVNGEMAAVGTLLRCGARLTLPLAATLADDESFGHLIGGANSIDRHLALALAAQHGHVAPLAALLDRGEDPSRCNPVGAHAHSTPLHQAAFYGHIAAVELLLAHGAATELRDTLWNGTPADWARHARRIELAKRLIG